MSRKNFPRLYELRDLIQYPCGPDAYSLDTKNEPVIEKYFRDIEAELRGLDSMAWKFLQAELAPLFAKKDARRGWEPLLNKFNEAKGYNYLVSIGCTDIEFIPRSFRQGRKTPDLQAWLGTMSVLCELKTINISAAESEHRTYGSVRSILVRLPIEFFNKLKATLETAERQLTEYSGSLKSRKIAYVVVNYDDILHEYEPNYSANLAEFIASDPLPGLEIVLDAKPAFYFATA